MSSHSHLHQHAHIDSHDHAHEHATVPVHVGFSLLRMSVWQRLAGAGALIALVWVLILRTIG